MRLLACLRESSEKAKTRLNATLINAANMRCYFCCCFIVVFLAVSGFAADASTKTGNDSAFVPTKEWQVLSKDTAIPAGLHVRINLQTGKREAKLLDEDEKEQASEHGSNEKQNSLTLHPEQAIAEDEEDMKVKKDELKAMLKKIKSDDAEELIQAAKEQVNSAVQKEFKTYAELKEQLDSLRMNISTDSEILFSLLEQFDHYKDVITSENIETKKVEDILDIFNDMEYLLHQIDNARIFTDSKGMAKVISPSLNSTNSDIKAEALRLLGTAVQSNPKVQLKALESDFVQKILYMLTINNKPKIRSRCLFALGALVRNFPAAQKNFINNGGFEIFGKILVDENSQVQVRVMNLINDLMIERENVKKIENEQERLKVMNNYDSMDFENRIVQQKYCENMVDLVVRSLRIRSGIDDFHEVIYESIITLNEVCKEDIGHRKNDLLKEVEAMLTIYRDYPVISEDGENLSSHNQELLEKVQRILLGEKLHDEL